MSNASYFHPCLSHKLKDLIFDNMNYVSLHFFLKSFQITYGRKIMEIFLDEEDSIKTTKLIEALTL